MPSFKHQIKTSSEIEKIKKACSIGDQAFDFILGEILTGSTEKEIARLIVRFMKGKNAGISFRPIVSFGKNASEIHHKPNDTRLRKNHGFVMIDLGAKFDGYCSDMTRTIFFGKANEKQKKIYKTVLRAQQKSVEYITNHLKTGQDISAFVVDKLARDYILSLGFPLIPHSVGHGIGRKVHEAPRISPKSKAVLKSGMVFTIEPGIYIKNFGGVRIEDTYLLEGNKLNVLSHASSALLEL